jgi:hypothetical protein
MKTKAILLAIILLSLACLAPTATPSPPTEVPPTIPPTEIPTIIDTPQVITATMNMPTITVTILSTRHPTIMPPAKDKDQVLPNTGSDYTGIIWVIILLLGWLAVSIGIRGILLKIQKVYNDKRSDK